MRLWGLIPVLLLIIRLIPVEASVTATSATAAAEHVSIVSNKVLLHKESIEDILKETPFTNIGMLGIPELEHLCEKHPENPSLWSSLGLVWENQQYMISNALNCFNKALTLSPSNLNIRLHILRCYMKLDNRAEIQKTFMAARTCPGSEILQLSLMGTARQLQGSGKLPGVILTEEYPATNSIGCLLHAYQELDDGNYAEALKYVQSTYELATNLQIRMSLNNICRYIAEAQRCEPAIRNIAAGIVLSNIPPYERVLYGAGSQERLGTGVSLEKIKQALALAENEKELWKIVQAAMQVRSMAGEEVIPVLCEAIGTNLPSGHHLYDAIYFYRQANLTNRLATLLERLAGDQTCTSREFIWALSCFRENRIRPQQPGIISISAVARPITQLIARMTARFPDNGIMLKIVADTYAQLNCISNAYVARSRGMACADIPEHIRAEMAATVIREYLQENMPAAAREILQENSELAKTYQVSAAAGAELYQHCRETNMVWDVLSKCATGSRFAVERLKAAATLLDYRWDDPSRQEWIIDTVIAELNRIGKPWQSISRLSYDQRRTFIAQARLLCREKFLQDIEEQRSLEMNNDRWPKTMDEKQFDALVRHMEQEGKTTALYYSELVRISRDNNLASRELSLRLTMLELEKQHPTFDHFRNTLHLAARLRNEKACARLAALIDKIPAFSVSPRIVVFIGDDMRACGLHQQFERLLDTYIASLTNIPPVFIISSMLKWGRTNTVENILEQAGMQSNLPLDQADKLLQLSLKINNTNKLYALTAQLEKRLTNSAAIATYGQQYIEMLSKLRLKDAAFTNQRERVVMAWLKNKHLPVSLRMEFMHMISQASPNCRDLLLSFLEEQPSPFLREQIQRALLSHYSAAGDTNGLIKLADAIMNELDAQNNLSLGLADKLSNVGLPDRALEIYERYLALSKDKNIKQSIMTRIMFLCIKMKKFDRAVLYADQLAADVRPGNTGNAQTIIDIYLQSGQPKKAVSLCIAAIHMATERGELIQLVSRLKRLAQYTKINIDDECQALIVDLRKQGRVSNKLSLLATLAEVTGDWKTAARYLEDSIVWEETPGEQADKYYRLAHLYRDYQMADKELDVLERSLAILIPSGQIDVIERIVEILLQKHRFQDAIDRGTAFMETPAYSELKPYEKDTLIRCMIQVYEDKGDKDAAWKQVETINSMDSYLSYACRFNRLDDALPRIQTYLDQNANDREAVNIMKPLLEYCERTNYEIDLSKALARIDMLADGPLQPNMMSSVAQLYEKAGQLEKAISYLKKKYPVVESKYREAFIITLARLLQKKDCAVEAMALLNSEPPSITITAVKAEILRSMRDYIAAADAYRDIITAIMPGQYNLVDGYLWPFVTMVSECTNEEVRETILNRVLAHKDVTSYLTAGTIYGSLDNYEEAANCYKKIFELTPDSEIRKECMEQFAYYSERAGKYEDAAGIYTKMLQRENNSWQDRVGCLEKQAAIYQRAEKFDAYRDVLRDAVRECEQALKRYDGQITAADIYIREAQLYQELGDQSALRDTLQYVVDHFPGTPHAEQAQRRLEHL